MNNEIKNKEIEVKDDKTYKCQICNKEAKDPVEAMTHYLHHGSTALAAVTAMIEDQRTGNITSEDKVRITEENRLSAQRGKAMTATQEA